MFVLFTRARHSGKLTRHDRFSREITKDNMCFAEKWEMCVGFVIKGHKGWGDSRAVKMNLPHVPRVANCNHGVGESDCVVSSGKFKLFVCVCALPS